MAHTQVAALKSKQAEDLARLEQLPLIELEAANQQADFDRREFDIRRIKTLLVNRNDIARVVADIEREGRSQELIVTVPEIIEIQQIDANGKVVSASGSTESIGIKVSVQGDPDDIVTFIHSVEHLPYILYVDSLGMQHSLPEPVTAIVPENFVPKPLAQANINIVLVAARDAL